MATSVIGGGFSFSMVSAGGTWSWTVFVKNITRTGQLVEVKDIRAPFGFLTDVAVPIPGDVVLAMSTSISDVQQQLSPYLTLISPPTLNVVITEGDLPVIAGTSRVRNSGAFGSIMKATATPSVPWISISPASIPGIPKDGIASFDLLVQTAGLLYGVSPYSGVVNFQDDRNPGVTPVTIVVTVLPRPVIALSPDIVYLTYSLLTCTAGGVSSFSVTNAGPPASSLNFTVAKTPLPQDCDCPPGVLPWLSIVTTYGGPLAAGLSADIFLKVVPEGVIGEAGTYSGTVRVSSLNSLIPFEDQKVALIVS